MLLWVKHLENYFYEGYFMNSFFTARLWYFLVIIAFTGIIKEQKEVFIAEHSEPNKPLNKSLGDDFRVAPMVAILLFLPLIYVAGYRDWSFGDTSVYMSGYYSYPTSISVFFNNFETYKNGKEPGFAFFTILIRSIFPHSTSKIWFVIIALITGVCLALAFRYYTSNITLCAFYYFASTDFFSWMMNGMRQGMVSAAAFFAFILLWKKKYVPFLIIILTLSTVHQSVLIVIPFYIAALGKPFNKLTVIILVVSIASIFFVGTFTNFLDSAMENTTYNNVTAEFEEDDGTNIFRVLFYSIPGILAIIYKKKIPEDAPEIMNISINMSLITGGIYAVSAVTSGIYIGRLPIYFSLFCNILIPWEMKTFFGESESSALKGINAVYLVFFCYQMHQWGLL